MEHFSDTELLGYSLHGLSRLSYSRGEYSKATDFINRVHVLAEQFNYKFGIGIALIQKAEILSATGDLDFAKSKCAEGLAILTEHTESIVNIMLAHNTMAHISFLAKDFETAEKHLMEVSKLYEKAPFREPYEYYLLTKGALLASMGNTREAVVLYKRGLELSELSPSGYTKEFEKRLLGTPSPRR